MCKEYYLNADENVLLVKERGESRILANWRDLEEQYHFSIAKLSTLQYWWENEPSSVGRLIEDGELDTVLTEIVASEREGIANITKQLGGDKMAEMLAREIWRG